MRTRRRALVLALAGFGLLTLAVFRPTPQQLLHTTPTSAGDAADALLLMWATSHVSRALFTDPVHLFDAGIFHPMRYTLAFGDHMIGEALAGLPVWLATHNPLLEFNLLSLASYALAATAMFAYARAVVGDVAAAVAAGLVFAFTPYRFHSPLWLQVLFTPFMPLTLLFWTRFVEGLRWRDWALWVACWVAHSLMGMYLAFYFALTMVCLAALALAVGPTRQAGRLWVGTLLAPVVALLLLAPTLWPYLYLRAVQGQVRSFGLDTSPSFFLPGPGTLSRLLFYDAPPGSLGPGVVAWALAGLGLVVGLRRGESRRESQRFKRTVQLTGLAVTLVLVVTPMRLQLALPGFDMLRNSNRAFVVSLLFLAVLVGEAVAWLGRRALWPRAAGAALVGLLILDMGTVPRERKPMPVGEEIPAVYRWLAALPPGEAIYEGWGIQRNPTLALYQAIHPMYYSIFHGQRLALGYSGFAGAGGAYVTMQLARFPDPEALRLLAALDVRYVVWHLPRPVTLEPFLAGLPRSVLEVAARFDTDVVLRLTDAPPPVPVAPLVHSLPRAEWRLAATTHEELLPALRDGDGATAWRIENARLGGPPSLTIDLGRPWPVAGVRCVPPDANAPGIYLAELELSADGTHWDSNGAWFRPDSLRTLLDRPRELRYYEARFPTTTARYVRLTSRAIAFPGWPWEIAEIEITGDCTAAAIPGCPQPG